MQLQLSLRLMKKKHLRVATTGEWTNGWRSQVVLFEWSWKKGRQWGTWKQTHFLCWQSSRKMAQVTHKMLWKEVKQVFGEIAVEEPDKFRGIKFNTIVGLCISFCDRHDLTIQQRTIVAQNPPARYATKLSTSCRVFASCAWWGNMTYHE